MNVETADRTIRYLNLRELNVFYVVAQTGSMAKAAVQLGIAQPSVSKAIGNLEARLKVQLFERSTRGVVPNMYGSALIKCSAAVFDELRQGVRSLEFLADPNVGELKIACVAGITQMLFFPASIERFRKAYPRGLLQIDDFPSRTALVEAMGERRYDLGFLRIPRSFRADYDLDIDELFEDRVVLVVGQHHRLARRRVIDLAELVDEPWIMASSEPQYNEPLLKAFEDRGLSVPRPTLLTMSVALRAHLLTTGMFVAPMLEAMLPPASDRSRAIKKLPVELPGNAWPVTMVRLKERTLVPMAEHFAQCVRAIVRSKR